MMPYFKDKNDGLYVSEFACIGWLEITKSEYDLLNPSLTPTPEDRKAEKQSEIDQLEATLFMTRGEREAWLIQMETIATQQSVSLEVLYQANPFYKKLKDCDDAVTALRAELKAIV